MTLGVAIAWHDSPSEDRRNLMRHVDKWYSSMKGVRLFVSRMKPTVSDNFNYAVQNLRGYTDAVMISGSDDFVSVEYIEEAKRLIKDGADYVVGMGCYMHDLLTGRSMYVPTSAPCGAGRVMSARLLDRLDWRPYDAGLKKCIEASMTKRIKDLGIEPVVIDVSPPSDRMIVGIKTDDNLWPYDRFATAYSYPVSNDYLAVFGIVPKQPSKLVPPIQVSEYGLEVDKDRATVKLTFAVDHELSRRSLPDVLRELAEHVSKPVELGPLVPRTEDGQLVY